MQLLAVVATANAAEPSTVFESPEVMPAPASSPIIVLFKAPTPTLIPAPSPAKKLLAPPLICI